MSFEIRRYERATIFIVLILIVSGVVFRFYNITENQFVYYDEGMWLNYNRDLVNNIERNPPQTFQDFINYINISFHASLQTGKALWAFIAQLRGLTLGADAWYFTRLISAIFGSLTLLITFLFVRKYTNSKYIALLSTVLLAVLPSHIYYSRLGLQEAFSSFCFIFGIYYYVCPKKIHWKSFLSAVLLACVFFANYRMIIIPVFTLFVECYEGFLRKRIFDPRKYLYHTLTFLGCVFLIGSIDQGANTYVTFGWMFHQTNLSKGTFDFINLFSYPYYLFRLESLFFGLAFFANIYYVVKHRWDRCLPFLLVCVLMIIFSFGQEKGVRYLTSVMPLMAWAVAYILYDLLRLNKGNSYQWGVLLFIALLFGNHLMKDIRIINFRSDYQLSMEDLIDHDPDVKVISSQHMIQKLYVVEPKNVIAPVSDHRFLIAMYGLGYRYLILGPQSYVSFTEDGLRFSQKLTKFFHFLENNVPPTKVYPHFNQHLLERFVFEHNENLVRSRNFLKANNKGEFGQLRVYDLTRCLYAIQKGLNLFQNQASKENVEQK